jgi:hypothetical protein
MLTAVAGWLLNTSDFGGRSLSEYFPLTNGDTFAYLGYIDQFRQIGWEEPRLFYPSGLAPVIEHALGGRLGGVVAVAGIAEALGLETHTSFFMMQRLAMVIIALAAAGFAGWVTGRTFVSLFVYLLLIVGNFLLHQVLQQFNSSTMGTVVAVPLLWVASWTLTQREGMKGWYVGTALTGGLAGALAMASPEAHPFFLLALTSTFVVVLLRSPRRLAVLLGGMTAIFSYGLVCWSIVIQLWKFMFGQFFSTTGSHPGNWIAAPGILVQYSGLTFTLRPDLWGYPMHVGSGAILFMIVLVGCLGVIVRTLIQHRRDKDHLFRLLLPFMTVTLIFFCAQGIFYLLGSGYTMLKTIDYAAFLPTVLVALGVHFFLDAHHGHRRAILALLTVGTVGFLIVAIDGKTQILKRYRHIVRGMPKVTDYHVADWVFPTPQVLIPDLQGRGGALDLFLYANRFGRHKIWIEQGASYRYRVIHATGPTHGWVVRVPRLGLPGLPLADITLSAAPTSDTLEILPTAGQVVIQNGGGWLDPEGEDVYRLRRSLGKEGGFSVFDLPEQNELALHLELWPGPDLRADNRIECLVNDRVIAILQPNDLPITVDLPLSGLAGTPARGLIRIMGAQAGPRQVFVLHLRTLPAEAGLLNDHTDP